MEYAERNNTRNGRKLNASARAALAIAACLVVALPAGMAAPGLVRTSISTGTLTFTVGACTAAVPATAIAIYHGTTLQELHVQGAGNALLAGQGASGTFVSAFTPCGTPVTGGSTTGLSTSLTCPTDAFAATLSTPAGLTVGYASGAAQRECLNGEAPLLGPTTNPRPVDLLQPTGGFACVGSVSVRLATPNNVELTLPGSHNGPCAGAADLCDPYKSNPAIASCVETTFLNQQTLGGVSTPPLRLACAYDRELTLDLNDDQVPEARATILWVEDNTDGSPC